jgi:catechol 2,3-dioxygenase-like lactoylglutathione lyase family enzyme
MLWTTDLDETVKFYCELLRFDCVNRMEGWAILRKDSIELMLSLPNDREAFDKIQFTGRRVLAAALRTRLRSCISLRISNTGCGSSPSRDNNGYILQFGQEI